MRIEIAKLAGAIGAAYVNVWRWCSQGLVRANIDVVSLPGKRRYRIFTVDMDGAFEIAVIARLRSSAVPLQRIRLAITVLRARGLEGPRWLALSGFAGDVLLCNDGELLRVADSQRFLHLLDVGQIRADVQRILSEEVAA